MTQWKTNPPQNPIPEDNEESLTQEEIRLRKELDEIARKREELRKRKELTKPVTFVVSSYNQQIDRVFFNLSFREDVVEYLRSFPARQYDGRRNSISRDEFLIMYGELNFLDKLPNITGFRWEAEVDSSYRSVDSNELRQRIIFNTVTPHYSIIVEQKKQYQVVLENNAPQDPLHWIPGARWNYQANAFLVPLSEGWRLYDAMLKQTEKSYIVKWSDEALEIAVTQTEKRNKVLELHTKEESDLDAFFLTPFKLRPFQGVGVEFAETMNGRWILGDQTGLGKTWQYVAYVNRQLAKNPNYKCIIVAPANLVINWMREIFKLTGHKAHLLSGTKPQPFDIAHMFKGTVPFFIINYDILATRNQFDRPYVADDGKRGVEHVDQWPWVEIILKCDFDSIAFDEAHYIKNTSSMRSQAARMMSKIPSVMLATATPVVNRVDELWPMLHIVDPDTFTYQKTFVNQYSMDGRNAKNVKELHELMKFIMIRRKKKDVQKDLPPVNDIVRAHQLSSKAQKIYDLIQEGIYEVMEEWNPDEAGNEKDVTHMLAMIMRMRQVCALDKAAMVADLATYIRDNEPEDNPNPKVIIFSYFKPVVRSIHNRLNDGGRSLMFTGDVPLDERMKIVDKFQDDPRYDYLVMTSSVAQEGLTLTRASSIIFADLFWTPKDHEQCVGRIYGRLNDSHECDAYWCIANNTIEDWMNQLLAEKRALIGQVVDGKEITGQESIAGELLRRMKEEMNIRRKK